MSAQFVVLLKLCRSAFGLALLKRRQENVAHAGSLGQLCKLTGLGVGGCPRDFLLIGSGSAASAARSSGSFALTSAVSASISVCSSAERVSTCRAARSFSVGKLKVLLESVCAVGSYRCLLCSCFLDLAARLTPGNGSITYVKRASQGCRQMAIDVGMISYTRSHALKQESSYNEKKTASYPGADQRRRSVLILPV